MGLLIIDLIFYLAGLIVLLPVGVIQLTGFAHQLSGQSDVACFWLMIAVPAVVWCLAYLYNVLFLTVRSYLIRGATHRRFEAVHRLNSSFVRPPHWCPAMQPSPQQWQATAYRLGAR